MPGHKSDYLEFGVKVGLDSKEAQKELQELQKQLNSLGTLSNPNVGDKLSADMQKASQAAAQLKIALDSAIDVDTGRLDLSKFSRSLKDSGMKLKDYRNQLMSMGPEGEKAFTQVANSILKAEAPLRRTSKLIDTMWTTFKNTVRWEFSSSILHGLESSLQKAITYAQDLNKSLTDIRIVTGYSTDRMAEFAIEANKAAKALSATTTEYTNASLIYFQQGLSDQQVKERTEVTVKMANVTRDSAQAVSDQMTAVWNNFADGSHTLEYYADVMTALGAATASSTKEISDGLEKFAAVAETVGLSYEYAASALATITSNTRQSADVVGTALKTLFARIQGLSLGETLEDGTDLNKYSEALAKVGIQVKEQNGELKAMDDILNEMADVWDKLDNDQQVALAQTVAGVRQYTQLVALMENWDNGDEDSMMANLRTSANATGALQEQADIYAESWEAARDRVTTALESIFNKLLKDEFFIDTLNNIEKIITGIDKFIDSIGGLQGVLTGLGAVATKVFSSQISSGLSNLAYNLNFKQAQENDKAMRKNAANLMYSMYSDSEDARPALGTAYQQIGDIQIKMIENAEKITAEEKEALNYTIERLKVIAAENDALDQQDEKISKKSTDIKKQHENIIIQQYGKNSVEHQNFIEDREKFENAIGKDNLNNQILKAEQNLVKETQKKLGKAKKGTKEYDDLQKALQEHEDKVKECVQKQNELKTEITKTQANYNKHFKGVKGKVGKDAGLKAREYGNAYREKDNAEKNSEKRIKNFEKSVSDANKMADGGQKSFKSWSDSITQTASGITSLSFGITTLANAWDTISNPDATGWQKLSTVFSSLAMGLPMVISGFKEAKNGLLSLNIVQQAAAAITDARSAAELRNASAIALSAKEGKTKLLNDTLRMAAEKLGIEVSEKATNADLKQLLIEKLGLDSSKKITYQELLEAAAKKINTATTGAETTSKVASVVATKAQTVANWGLLASMPPLLAITLAIVAAFAALAAVVAVVSFAVKRYNEVWSEEAQMNLAKQALEETTAAAEKAKTAYEELKSTVESYRESVNAIDELKEGTEEYSQAIEKANKQAKELIETYDLYGDWKYGKDGLIEIDQYALNKKIDEKELQAKKAENSRYGAEIVYQDKALKYEQDKIITKSIGGFIKSEFNNLDTAGIVSKGIAEGRGSGPNYQSKEKIKEYNYKETFDGLQKFLKDIDNLDVLTGEQILAELESMDLESAAAEELNGLLNSASSIFTDEELLSALKEYTVKTIEAAEASKYFAEQIVRNEIEEKYGDKIREMATTDGVFDETRYNEILNSMVASQEQANIELGETLGNIDLSSITNNASLNTFLKQNNSEEHIKNDKDLALTYARLKYGMDESELAYIKGKNMGSIQTMDGEYLFQDLSDDVMRKEVARMIAEEQALQQYMNSGGTDQEGALTAIDNITQGADAAGAKYGENFVSALLMNISNKSEVFDFSSIFDELTPEEVEALSGEGLTSEEFLKMLGLNWEDLEKLGWESAEDFQKAFQSGLENYSEEDYYSGLMQQGRTKAEETGFDPDVYENYVQIMKSSGQYAEFTEEKIHELALANMECERGLVTLTENWEDWQNKLENGNITEVAEATNELQNAFMDITGLPKEIMKKFDADFFKKYSKEIFDVVKGTEGSIQKMKKIIGKESLKIQLEVNTEIDTATVLKELEPLHDIIASFNAESIEIGAKIDDTQFLAACQGMIDALIATGYTAEQAQGIVEGYLSSMGFNVEVERKKVPIKGQIPGAKNYSLDEDGNVMLDGNQPGLVEGFTEVLSIKSITKNASWGGNIKVNDSTADDSGGGSASNAEPLEYEDEIERYHENTRQLERLTRALEKVSTAKDRAFGKERLRLIDEEIAATEKLVAQQRALLHETREYLKQDFAEIQQYGFTTDQYGEITNYDEVMQQQIDKYNAAVATGNQDIIDAAKKEYDEFKENMQQYEETLTAYEEAQAQLQEYINQVVDLKLEKITTEVEIKILVNDKELTRLEYLLRKIEYEGKGAADAIALMGRQFEQINEKAKPIQEAIDKIYEQARAEGRGLLEEEVMEIKSFYQDGTISSEEEKRIQEIYDKAASEDRMLTQAEEEQIQEYKEQLLELNEEVMDLVETVEGKFMETLEELNGKVDESIGRFATYTGMFQTLSDVITLSGKAGSKYGMDMLNTLSARTVANASTAMRSSLRSYEALDQIYKEEQANLERAIKTGDERLIKQYQDRLHEVEMMRETSYESMLSSWSEALQAANDLFDTKLTNMITSLKQNLGDIDKLVEIYDRAVELEDLYISGNKSIYELSKLARDIGKDIDKTANIIAKNKLVGLLDQINKLRAEGVKLSQYDLEYWQAKYELELAEIALQEAQEAKAQVKLTRNTAGGWGYTYTADAEAISEAQQNYEDSLYNMQELHDEYIKDYSERLIKNRQELVNALQDLDKTSLTFEEDALRLKEHYFKQEEYLIDELNKAYQRAGVSYQDTLLAQTYGGASLEDSHTNFINSVVKMIQDELLPGYREFQESVDDINSQAGTTVEDAMDKIFESSITMEDEVIKNINDLTSGIKEVSDEIWNFQETYGEAIAKMLQDNEDYYSKTIKMYQNFMDETEADKWLQYFDDMRSPGEVLGLAGSGTTGAMAGNGSTAVTNGAFGGILDSLIGNGKDSTTYPSRKSSGNGIKIILGEGLPPRVYLNDDGTYSGIASGSDGEEIPESAMRALREEPSLKGKDLRDYAGDDNTLEADELKKLFKDNDVDHTKYIKDYNHVKSFGIVSGATGMYTGSWGPEGKLALLHEKELVLNKFDTENMLDMVNTLRNIDWRAKIAELWPAIEEKFIMPALNQAEELLQEVHIEANFPGVSDRSEIEEAFNNLINTASQYANRKRY